MKYPRPQNTAERESLDSFLEKLREEWGFAVSFGLDDLLEKWQRFVKGVEEGYELSIYDFTHDLSMRDLLEEAKEAVPPRLRQEIDMVIKPWDERFHLATQPSARSIDAGVEEGAKEWWFRIPRHAGPEIESYLLSEGLLDRR